MRKSVTLGARTASRVRCTETLGVGCADGRSRKPHPLARGAVRAQRLWRAEVITGLRLLARGGTSVYAERRCALRAEFRPRGAAGDFTLNDTRRQVGRRVQEA